MVEATPFDPVNGSPWRLSVRAEGDAYTALLEFPGGEVSLEGTEPAEDLATAANGVTLASLPPEAVSVEIVSSAGTMTEEAVQAANARLETRFLFTRLPIGEETTLIVKDASGGELSRIHTTDGEWTTQP